MLYSFTSSEPLWTHVTVSVRCCFLSFPSCPKKALGPTYAALLPAKAGWAKAALGRYCSHGEHQEVDSLLGKAGGSEAGGWTAC